MPRHRLLRRRTPRSRKGREVRLWSGHGPLGRVYTLRRWPIRTRSQRLQTKFSSAVDGRISLVSDNGETRRGLPRLERGRDLSRILAFTDGVFAIAITLLVLQIEVPDDLRSNHDFITALGDMLPDLFAFGISFAVIGVFWINHHRLMRTVREYDQTLIWLTLLYLAWVVLLPFSSQLIGEYGNDIKLSAAFYILNLALIAISQALMTRAILRHQLGEPDYIWDLKLNLRSSLYTAAVFLVTAPVGLLLGGWTPLTWIVLLALDPWQRQRDRIYDRPEA